MFAIAVHSRCDLRDEFQYSNKHANITNGEDLKRSVFLELRWGRLHDLFLAPSNGSLKCVNPCLILHDVGVPR